MANPNITRFTLCGVQGCCPVVEVNREAKAVTITDDDGGKVTLTEEQWRQARTEPTLEV